MAKAPDMSHAQVAIVLNALDTQEAVFTRAKRANLGDPDMVAVYDKRLADLSVVRGFFQGALV